MQAKGAGIQARAEKDNLGGALLKGCAPQEVVEETSSYDHRLKGFCGA
jgi:hypothetical protein